MGDSKRDIKQWLDCYDPEIRVFPDLRKRLAKGEGLGKRDVLLIVKWKLGRIRGSNSKTVSDENLKKINTAIVEAAKPEKALAALKALEEVPGIVLATATAILTFCYPDTFTIIDERVLESLDLLPGGHEKRREGRRKKRERKKANTTRRIGLQKRTWMNICRRLKHARTNGRGRCAKRIRPFGDCR